MSSYPLRSKLSGSQELQLSFLLEANLKEAQEYMNFQIIGHDKLNQLRHVKFFQNLDGVMNQMKKAC